MMIFVGGNITSIFRFLAWQDQEPYFPALDPTIQQTMIFVLTVPVNIALRTALTFRENKHISLVIHIAFGKPSGDITT